MESASKAPPHASRVNGASGRDAFVLAAMCIVVVAIGTGLYMHFEAGFMLAVATAVAVYAGLLTVHVVIRRARTVADLRAEVSRLNAQIVEIRRHTMPRVPDAHGLDGFPRGAPPLAAAPHLRAPAAAPAAVGAPDTTPPPPMDVRPSLAEHSASLPATLPVAAAEEPADKPAPHSAGPAAVEPLPPPQMPNWSIRPGLHREPPLPDLPAESLPFPPAPARPLDMSRPIEPPADATPVSPPSAMREHVGTASGLPPLAAAERMPPAPELPLPASQPSAVPASAGSEPAERDAREFDTMQVLIKQLAAQLSAPAGEPSSAIVPEPPAVEPAATDAPDVIGQSVAALRATAGEMRHADQPAARPPTLPRDIGPQGANDLPFTAPSAATAPPSPYGRLALIAEAVTAERIDVYLDPILALDERRARHFEVSVRLRTSEDESLDESQFGLIATESGLMARIDSAKLTRTAQVAERLRARGSNGSLFSTLAGDSIADHQFMSTFANVFSNGPGLGHCLVLAFSQSDVRGFADAHWEALTTMAGIGLRFALEEVADLDMDFERLKASGFDFVKLDAKVFLEGLPAANGTIPASDLCRHLSGLGLSLIVGHIEDERDLAKIVGFGVLFGQGTLFGGARPVRLDPVPSQAAA